MAETVPLTTPGAPTGLTATIGPAQVRLSWAAPASDGGAPVSRYTVYQGTSPGGETGAPVSGSPVGGTTTSTTVSGLVTGTTYYFKVVAFNAAGQSPLSAEASATLPPPVVNGSSVPPPAGATAPASTGPGVASSTPASEFGVPTGLTATAGNTQVHLSWAAPADSGPPVSGYRVYLATAPGVRPGAALASTTGTAGTVANLVNGTVYYFMVTAVDAAGTESPASTEVSARPAGPAHGVTVSLDRSATPGKLTAVLAALAALAVAGAATLAARYRHGHPRVAPAQDVRAVPDIGRPSRVSVLNTGPRPTQTVRLEPHPGVATTTIKEGRP